MNRIIRKTATHQTLEPLNDLDWRVVDDARADSILSMNPDGVFATPLRLLGLYVARPLANEALEALRCFAVRAWHSRLIRSRDMCALHAGGFSTNHAEEILAHIAASRGFTPSIQERFHGAHRARNVG